MSDKTWRVRLADRLSVIAASNRLTETEAMDIAQAVHTLRTERVGDDEVCTMALCEASRIIPHVGRLYRFVPAPGCVKCDALSHEYDDVPGLDTTNADHRAVSVTNDAPTKETRSTEDADAEWRHVWRNHDITSDTVEAIRTAVQAEIRATYRGG